MRASQLYSSSSSATPPSLRQSRASSYVPAVTVQLQAQAQPVATATAFVSNELPASSEASSADNSPPSASASAAACEYPSTSRFGVPGTPGTVDLMNALRRLSPRLQSAASAPQVGWRTPDSIMSTGSRSAFTSLTQQYPEKLKIIKPIEGSTTLHHWSRLATPNFAGALLDQRPGVATRETETEAVHRSTVDYSRGLLEFYSLFDVEEDEVEEFDASYPANNFHSSASVYTLTNSTVMHPDQLTRLTSSLQQTCVPVTSIGRSATIQNNSAADAAAAVATTTDARTTNNNNNSSPPCRRNSVSTFSTQMALAKALQERGVHDSDGAGPGTRSGWSTPNNSPHWSPPGSPLPAASYGPLDLLHRGAKMIRRTLTGRETPAGPPVPRMSKRELEV